MTTRGAHARGRTRRPTAAIALPLSLAWVVAAGGCESTEETSVGVTLSTEYTPGVEFDEVRTELILEGRSEAGVVSARLERVRAREGDDFTAAREVASFRGVAPGTYETLVKLLRAGAPIDEQGVVVTTRGAFVVDIVMPRKCTEQEVDCGNFRDDDCDGKLDCADEECTNAACNGFCVENGTCGAGGLCENGEPVSCDDQNPCTDDSCDPGRGCEHANNAATCNDGNACTADDTCEAGSCVGDEADCDDQNPCTADGCDTETGCTHTGLDKTCDDGAWCNGPDRCDPAAGTCSLHPNPRCVGMPCSNTLMACVECAADADCGAPQISDWTPCAGFEDGCDATGSQSRSGFIPRCNASNVCVNEPVNETRECTRGVPGEGGDCGFGGRFRCCGGRCADTFTNIFHCGGCNFWCYSGQACAVTTKGVAACRCTNGFMCPSGGCRVGQPADNNFCDCDTNAHCPAGKVCTQGASGIDVCI